MNVLLGRLHLHEAAKPWGVFCAVFAITALLLGALLYWSRTTIQSNEVKRLEGVSRYVDESLSRQFLGLEGALVRLAHEYQELRLASSVDEASRHISMLRNALQSVRELAVYDANGVAVASESLGDIGKNFYTAEFFSALRLGHDKDAVHLTRPELDPSGKVIVHLSRGVYGSDGIFQGVVSAVLDQEFFSFVIKSALLAPDMRATLAHEDGQIFVTVPSNPAAYSVNVKTPGSGFSRHIASGQERSVFEGLVTVTGQERFLMLNSISPSALKIEKTVVLAISRDLKTVYAGWRSQVLIAGLGYFSALIGAFVLRRNALLRARKLQELQKKSQALLQLSASRLERALDGADLGLWEVDLDHQFMDVDSRGASMLGYGALPVRKSVSDWMDTVHPDDRQRNREAFQRHITRRSENYECEFRVEIANRGYRWFFGRGKATEFSPDGKVFRIVGTFMDINDRKASESTLSDALQLLKRTGQIAKIGGWTLDVHSETVSWTEEVYAIHDLEITSPPELNKALDFYTSTSRPVIVNAVQECMATGRAWNTELQIVTAKGRLVWVRSQGEPIFEGASVVKLAGTFQDITEQKQATLDLERANEILAELSYTDALTGLGNRRLFDESLNIEWVRMSRRNAELSLLMIDIDYFKRYNDLYGHQGGDSCLRQIAAILKENLWRSHERALRYGGEEFVVLLPETSLSGATLVAERLLQAVLSSAIPHDDSPISDSVSLSIGVATIRPTVNLVSTTLTSLADKALYEAKAKGRARLAISVG